MNGNRVWLYRCAASGKDSASVLLMQKRELEAYAQEHQLEIVGRSGDEGSGPLFERPGLMKFNAVMERRRVDILLMSRLACLGRDSDEVARYWQSLREHGVRLCTVAEGEVYLDMRSLFRELFGSKERR